MKSRALPVSLLAALASFAAVACGGDQSAPPVTANDQMSADAAPPSVVVDAAPPPAPLSATTPPADWPYLAPTAVHGTKGMVVSDAHLASDVGRDILRAGGNAADAAAAVGFALAVVFPTAGNIGGGGFAVAKMNGKSSSLDFRETAPFAAKKEMYTGSDGKPTKDSNTGPLSVGVPGSVAGFVELYTKLGSKKLTLAQVMAPAIKLAKEGFEVDDAFLDTLKKAEKPLKAWPGSAALYFANGAPPAKGAMFKNPDLATTLERVAQHGAAGFYSGPTAAAIVKEMKEDKGLITAKDLASYKAKWRDPIVFSYRGHEVVSMPPPSSGGVTLEMIANIAQGYDLGKMGFESPAALHIDFEAMRRAYAARNAKLGDPDFAKIPVAELTSAAWADAQRATIKPDMATPSSEIVSAPASGVGPHTTHYSVVDSQGNAVAITTTVNWWFGSGITVRGAGFVLNNEMDDFATVVGQANGFGLVQGEANAVGPGHRMLSSMAPTIVSKDGKIEVVLGAAGGPTITTAVFQEMSNVLDFGLDPAHATGAPRFHMQHLPDQVMSEAKGLAPATKAALEAMKYTFAERGHIADAPLIGRDGDGWTGVAEPRRDGGGASAE